VNVVSTVAIPVDYAIGPCGSQMTVSDEFVLYVTGMEPLSVVTTVTLPTAAGTAMVGEIWIQFAGPSAEFTAPGEIMSLVKT
jgi:hypothetical protein